MRSPGWGKGLDDVSGSSERADSRTAPLIEFSLPARPEFVAVARELVASVAARRLDLDPEHADDVRLAVSEAVTNAIEVHNAHAIGRDVLIRVRPVGVRGETAASAIEVEVVDAGPGFDPDTLQAHPQPTDPARLNFERGLGIPLIRSIVDDLAFDCSTQGTSVRMRIGRTHGHRPPTGKWAAADSSGEDQG